VYSCSDNSGHDSICKLGARMKDSFNFNFYITSATVIPLLYITLFLQTEQMQNLAKSVGDEMQQVLDTINYRIAHSSGIRHRLIIAFGIILAYPVMLLVSWAFLAIGLCGFVAEVLSLVALYTQWDNSTAEQIVLGAMLALLALVIINPTITVYLNLWSKKKPDTTTKLTRKQAVRLLNRQQD
jgi:hypothetical protein